MEGRGTPTQTQTLLRYVQESYDGGRHRRVRRADRQRRRAALTPEDSAIFFNFRPDRARQLSRLLLDRGFDLTTMTRYSEDLDCPVAFDEMLVEDTIAEVLSRAGLRQLHVAETEKYAHVTYFFNGGREEEWPGETRMLVPSPRDVPSYDLKPEMSAREAADALLRRDRQGLRVRRDQLREPGHGRPHGVDSRDHRSRSRRPMRASARSSTRSPPPAASASSPPTTATPSS